MGHRGQLAVWTIRRLKGQKDFTCRRFHSIQNYQKIEIAMTVYLSGKAIACAVTNIHVAGNFPLGKSDGARATAVLGGHESTLGC